jgi:hypothetical protein
MPSHFRKPHLLNLLVITLVLLATTTESRLIIESSSIGNWTLETSQYYWKDDDLSLTFEPVTSQLANASFDDLAGKIVYLPKVNANDWLRIVTEIQDKGAIAIIYGTGALVPGQYGCGLTANRPSGIITIPVSEINDDEFEPILEALGNGTIVVATLTSEGSPWIDTIVSAAVIVVFRAILPAACVGLIGYALYKLILFVRFQGSQFNVPQVCLALEIIANLLRLIYLPVDPFACFGVYGQTFSFITTISFPYEIATFILITFYWYEALTDPSIKIYPFLARFKPFFFVFIILFIVVIFVVTIIGYYLVFEITTPVIVIYLIVSLAFLIFYIVTVVKIGNKVKQASTLRFETKQHVLGVNKKIIINGIVRVISLIPVIIFIAPTIATVPLPHVVASAFIYATIIADSWARIYLFSEPTTGKGSSAKTASGSGSGNASTAVSLSRSASFVRSPRERTLTQSEVAEPME